MINNENEVRIEGYVFQTPEEYTAEGNKRVANFAIENQRYSEDKIDKQLYNCVIWNKQLDKYGDMIKEGNFVRIKGHLQSNTLELADGKRFKYAKICVDHMEAEE
jgi:single-stranded DNA-binding protein